MERETGIEPASLAWKARVLPLNYSRAGLHEQADLQLPTPLGRTLVQLFCHWWRGLDSNQRTRKRADLQSAAINHSATSPKVNSELCHFILLVAKYFAKIILLCLFTLEIHDLFTNLHQPLYLQIVALRQRMPIQIAIRAYTQQWMKARRLKRRFCQWQECAI